VFAVKNLTKTYQHRREPVHALNNVSVEIAPGSFVAVTGPSGSGKTTLLLSLGGLIRPAGGEVLFKGTSIYKLHDKKLAEYRNQSIGFVLQTFNLIPYLTALENVMVPMLFQPEFNNNGRSEKAMALLKRIGMGDRIDFLPRELSVGQQQRVAIARALANDPEVILADEPTGNLDPELSNEILDIMKNLNLHDGKTIVLVTHDPLASDKAERNLRLDQGVIT
jgi:putative ABC transport system ATP-binding protein